MPTAPGVIQVGDIVSIDTTVTEPYSGQMEQLILERQVAAYGGSIALVEYDHGDGSFDILFPADAPGNESIAFPQEDLTEVPQ